MKTEKRMLHVKLPIWKLQPHPKNVRKSVGDVSELAESIKAQGIMQNLLVVPVPGHEESLDLFYVVIGNRRLAAAEMAKLEELPCTIAEGLTEQEQIELMLVENLQRRDLTPQEEAQAYEQLTLDFGLSAAQIAKKTGVSESTIRRRLKITELDQGEITKKSFQLSIGDYAALEKVKDPKLRNKVLAKAESPENLKYMADKMAEFEVRKEKVATLVQNVTELYDGKITRKKSDGHLFLGTLNPGDSRQEVKKKLARWGASDYSEICINDTEVSSFVYIYGKREKVDPGKTEESREKLRQQKRDRDHRFVLKKCRDMANARRLFIHNVLNGVYRLPPEISEQEAQVRLWRILRGVGSLLTDVTTLTAYWMECERYQTDDTEKALMAEMPEWKQMLAAAGQATDRSDFLCKYGGEYDQEAGETLQSFIRFLGTMGYSVADQDEKAVLEGIHDCWESA